MTTEVAVALGVSYHRYSVSELAELYTAEMLLDAAYERLKRTDKPYANDGRKGSKNDHENSERRKAAALTLKAACMITSR